MKKKQIKMMKHFKFESHVHPSGQNLEQQQVERRGAASKRLLPVRVAIVAVEIVALEEGPRPDRCARLAAATAGAAATVAAACARVTLVAGRSGPALDPANPTNPDASPARRAGSGGRREGYPVPEVLGLVPVGSLLLRGCRRRGRGRLRQRMAVIFGAPVDVPRHSYNPILPPGVHARARSRDRLEAAASDGG
jgi:hypothetical protein